MHTVRQKHHKQLLIRIDPDGSSRKAGVTESMRTHKVSARSAFSGHSPSKSSRAAGKLLRHGEFCNCGAPQDPVMRVNTAIQQHFAECRQVGRGAENTGMARNTADCGGVFLVNFALDKAMA